MAEKHLKNNDPKRAAHLERYKWKPGTSGNGNGRPPSQITLISKQKELYATEAPPEMLKGIEQFIPPVWKAKGRKVTWLEAQVIRNSAKALSLKYGDLMAKLIWEQLEGKAVMQISGPNGGPLQLQETKVDLRNLTEKELRVWEALLEKAALNGDDK